MKKESIQQKIGRIRPPRVHITYDVEVGGAMVMKELPFVVGVMGDFSGQPAEGLPPVRDRKFVQIDRDNFDQVLAGMKPRLVLRVPNKLSEEGGSMSVELKFEKLDDFHPDNLVQQVEPLRKLVELRQNLNDLLAKMDGNEKLGNILEDIMNNTEAQKQLGAALGIEETANGEDKKGE
ncbi:MAG TPA: type VI secretion system contractile sheath small subunit [Blastocatellia bacterium]|jgi:type VI secretion system protein ImpB|nr:type VI secretion system contractile sheath small subunit [Blastocatellia bacterium]